MLHGLGTFPFKYWRLLIQKRDKCGQHLRECQSPPESEEEEWHEANEALQAVGSSGKREIWGCAKSSSQKAYKEWWSCQTSLISTKHFSPGGEECATLKPPEATPHEALLRLNLTTAFLPMKWKEVISQMVMLWPHCFKRELVCHQGSSIRGHGERADSAISGVNWDYIRCQEWLILAITYKPATYLLNH